MQPNKFVVVPVVLLAACSVFEPSAPSRPMGVQTQKPRPRYDDPDSYSPARTFRTQPEHAENTPITMREEEALSPAPAPQPPPPQLQPLPARTTADASTGTIRAAERQEIIEISKAEQKRKAFVPTALADTPSRQIEVVSAEDVKEYEVLIYSEARAGREPIQKHKVAKGETLYSIANKYGVKVYNLAEINKISPPFTLSIGQELKISDDVEKAETAAKIEAETKAVAERFSDGKTFVKEGGNEVVAVKKGDTVYSIARANNVPLRDFILLNELSPPYTISVGQRLYLPSTAFHIVKKQDTLYSISRAYGVNMRSLASLNNITDASKLSVGQKLVLPAAATPEDTTKRKFIVPVDSDKSKVIDTVRKSPAAAPAPAAETAAIEPAAAKIIESPAAMTGNKFAWPVKGKIISEFGVKSGGNRNDGINIQAAMGTPVLAAQNGIVAYAGNELKGLGNLVIIRHANDFITIYAHNDKLLVEKDEKVEMGDKIATVGKSGRATSPQLHFQIRQRTNAINPATMLK